MYRWLFPKFQKIEMITTKGDIHELYRLSIVYYLLRVLPRWLITACLSLIYLTCCNCFGKSECTIDIVIAWLITFLFGYLACMGYGAMKILNLSEEEVDKIFKAVAGDNYKL